MGNGRVRTYITVIASSILQFKLRFHIGNLTKSKLSTCSTNTWFLADFTSHPLRILLLSKSLLAQWRSCHRWVLKYKLGLTLSLTALNQKNYFLNVNQVSNLGDVISLSGIQITINISSSPINICRLPILIWLSSQMWFNWCLKCLNRLLIGDGDIHESFSSTQQFLSSPSQQ